MKYYLPCLFFLLLLIISASCTKEETQIIAIQNDTLSQSLVTLSDTPNIAFKSISSLDIIEYQEPLFITFTYIDGDGDLGQNFTDIKNLFVEDSRNSITYEYRIPQLAPDTLNKIAITGTFKVKINTIALTNDNNTNESLFYRIHVVDRAGNKSNVISSSTFQVRKP